MPTFVNKTFDEIVTDASASVERTVQSSDLRAGGTTYGDADLLAGSGVSEGIAGIVTDIMTAMVGTELPGPGAEVRSISLQIKAPLPLGVPLTTRLVVRERRPADGSLLLDGTCTDPTGTLIAAGTLEVLAPTRHCERQLPEHRLEGLLDRCHGLKPMATGVIHPCSPDALGGAVAAAEAGLIVPVLYGPEAELRRIADRTTSPRWKTCSTNTPACSDCRG